MVEVGGGEGGEEGLSGVVQFFCFLSARMLRLRERGLLWENSFYSAQFFKIYTEHISH